MADLLNILVVTAIYGLYASGFTLIFGLFDVLNLAHASVFAFAAAGAMYVASTLETGLLVSAAIAITGAVVLGVLVERVAFRPLRYRDHTAWSGHMGPLITSLGAASILVGLQTKWFGVDPLHFPATRTRQINFGDSSYQIADVAAIVLLVAVFVGLQLLIRSTKWGMEVRGVALEPRTMPLLGINVERRIVEAFALAGALGGVAGVLWALKFNTASASSASQVEVRGFAIIIIGGMGSIPGALIGAVILAASEVLSVRFLPSGWQALTVYSALILVLLARPGGVMGVTRDPST